MCVVQVTEESGQWNANPSLLCTSCGNVVLTPLLLYTHSNSIASLLWSRISKIRIAGAGEKAQVKSMAVLTEDLGSVPSSYMAAPVSRDYLPSLASLGTA